jgi:hypothetical protein
MFFVRRNDFSKTRETKIISRHFEEHIIGRFLKRKIGQAYSGLTYKQDTPEVQRVTTCIESLTTANNLGAYLHGVRVVVLHNTTTAAMFMGTDRTFFITVAALSLAKTQEQLTLLVAHELSHYLLDH